MAETMDPRESLGAPDVKTRAAAARDLALVGDLSDLERLVQMAVTDASSAVRLYAAGAASDIVSRHRSLDHQGKLTADMKTDILGWVGRTDPGVNPSLLMVLAAIPDERAINRLGRMLRDPRNMVRGGAAMAVRRMAMSSETIDDRLLPAAIPKWFNSGKLPADASLELIRLIGEAGWPLSEQVTKAASAGRPHVAASQEALQRLRARAEPEAWHGLWLSDGLDVLEVADAGSTGAGSSWLAVTGNALVDAKGEKPWQLKDGRLVSGRQKLRMIWGVRAGGDERFVALQSSSRTWWRQDGKALTETIGEIGGSLPRAAAAAARRWLLEGDEAPTVPKRIADAVLQWRAGDAAGATEALREMAAAKRPRKDVHYWLARVLADQGDRADALAELEIFLTKAKAKKDRWRQEARDLRTALAN